jgi:hypothetical protein
MSNSKRVTVQDCIIGPGVDPQRFGALVESDDVTFARNLWISNQSRNPKAKGRILYVNNVVYNWGVAGLAGGHSAAPHELDAITNYFIAGPNSNSRFTGEYTETDHVYQSGNFVDGDKDGVLNGKAVVAADFADSHGVPTMMDKPTGSLLPFAYEPLTAEAALKQVLENAGALPQHRDAIDQQLIDDVRSFGKRGKIVHDPKELELDTNPKSAEPTSDTDRDGMPDAWESQNLLDPHNPDDRNLDPDHDGYTNLEEYLNTTSPHVAD